ncbi:MAG: HAD family hydrolase, partial [Gammaproteobacteria bacterium]
SGVWGALGIEYAAAMLCWPAGWHATEGVWAPAWLAAVERSTGFEAPPADPVALPAGLQQIADAALPHYEAMAAQRLR